MFNKIHYPVSCALAALLLSGPVSADSTRDAIEAVNAQFVGAFGHGDSKGVAALYTSNASLCLRAAMPSKAEPQFKNLCKV
jgi:ketosteroid isomerase-like protein